MWWAEGDLQPEGLTGLAPEGWLPAKLDLAAQQVKLDSQGSVPDRLRGRASTAERVNGGYGEGQPSGSCGQ